jgi:hypothetical protein
MCTGRPRFLFSVKKRILSSLHVRSAVDCLSTCRCCFSTYVLCSILNHDSVWVRIERSGFSSDGFADFSFIVFTPTLLHIVFIQFISGDKKSVGRTLKMTAHRHPVASLECTDLYRRKVVLGHKFKLKFKFITRGVWKSSGKISLNIVLFSPFGSNLYFTGG